MATASARDGRFLLVLSEKEFRESGLSDGKEFDLLKARDGLLLLSEKPGPQKDELAERVISLLRRARLPDRVEKRFEKKLNSKELEKFRELLKQGKIVAFRLSEKYKRAVYKTPQEIAEREAEDRERRLGAKDAKGKSQQQAAASQKSLSNEAGPSNYSLAKNGFMVVSNENEAKRLSDALAQKIKDGEIKGMKSFDGPFYIIESFLYRGLSAKILKFLEQKKSASAADIAGAIGSGSMAVKIACEFLKEDGSIFEKKKEQYAIV